MPGAIRRGSSGSRGIQLFEPPPLSPHVAVLLSTQTRLVVISLSGCLFEIRVADLFTINRAPLVTDLAEEFRQDRFPRRQRRRSGQAVEGLSELRQCDVAVWIVGKASANRLGDFRPAGAGHELVAIREWRTGEKFESGVVQPREVLGQKLLLTPFFVVCAMSFATAVKPESMG